MDEQIIIKEYLDGKSISKLSKEYLISYKAIQKILRQNHIPIRGGRAKVTFIPLKIWLLLKKIMKKIAEVLQI